MAHCLFQDLGHEMKVAAGRFRKANDDAPLNLWVSAVELSATVFISSKVTGQICERKIN